MKKRNVRSIFLFQFLTLGFYFVYWCWRSKNEVNSKLGSKMAPTVWWFLVPFGGYWWAWKYAEAVEKATKRRIKYSDVFLYYLLATLGLFGLYWIPSPDRTIHHDGSYNGGVVVAVLIVYFILFIGVMGIFPAAMQNRFNKLAKK